jgi:hypothetical protein
MAVSLESQFFFRRRRDFFLRKEKDLFIEAYTSSNIGYLFAQKRYPKRLASAMAEIYKSFFQRASQPDKSPPNNSPG